jgi:hypothetical protein
MYSKYKKANQNALTNITNCNFYFKFLCYLKSLFPGRKLQNKAYKHKRGLHFEINVCFIGIYILNYLRFVLYYLMTTSNRTIRQLSYAPSSTSPLSTKCNFLFVESWIIVLYLTKAPVALTSVQDNHLYFLQSRNNIACVLL